MSRLDRPGLQAERTGLAWERTSLALLVNGALLVLHHLRGTGPAGLPLAGAGLVVALLCVVLGARRARRIRSGAPVAVARRSLLLVGTAVVAFGLAVVVVLAVGSAGVDLPGSWWPRPTTGCGSFAVAAEPAGWGQGPGAPRRPG